jgi:hypothetical protein
MAQTQNHIHLSLTLGGAPENAPDTKWKTLERVLIPTLIGTVERTLSGHFRHYEVVDELGDPVRPLDHYYKLIVREEDGEDEEERLEKLLNMYGRIVYLVDHKHVDDGEDHTANVKTMYFSEMGEIIPVSVGVFRYEVEVTLIDASRM